MKQTIVCALIGFLLMGCNEEIVDRPAGDGEGRLVFSDFHIESVVGDIQTKASLEQGVIPQASDFELTVVDAATSAVVKKLSAGVTDCFLSEGTYKVQAVYGDEAAMSATPYFFGESNVVTITKGAEASVSLTASLACAVLRPVIDPELAAQYETYKLTVQEEGKEADPVEVSADKDLFVRGGAEQTYTLTLAGTNQLSEAVSHTWKYSNLVVRTRYIINCNPDLPAFTLPAQSEGNVWSKFMYITPMTAENMTAHSDMAEKVIANVVYEASKDNGQTWIASEKLSDGRHVIKGLEPSTTYTVRSRFGAIYSSDVQAITTENAQPLENGDMEKWRKDTYTTYGLKDLYLYYPESSAQDKYWCTKNPLTMDGVTNGTSSGTDNQITAYRWNSCTIPTNDAVSGQAAEIRTMALANIAIKGTEVGSGLFWAQNKVAKIVEKNHTVYTGLLYTGNKDISTSNEIMDRSGILHKSRPVSLCFDYKYAPHTGDNCVIYACLYDELGNNIAETSMFKSKSSQNEYTNLNLKFVYSNLTAKASYLFIMFQSGERTTWNDVSYIAGSYKANPWSLDTFVGSVLKIDNVTLNYDYE